jgi:hypothetical protein
MESIAFVFFKFVSNSSYVIFTYRQELGLHRYSNLPDVQICKMVQDFLGSNGHQISLLDRTIPMPSYQLVRMKERIRLNRVSLREVVNERSRQERRGNKSRTAVSNVEYKPLPFVRKSGIPPVQGKGRCKIMSNGICYMVCIWYISFHECSIKVGRTRYTDSGTREYGNPFSTP